MRASIGKDANMSEATPVVGIIMGSESDMPAMEPCMAQLDAMGVPYEVKVASAHRKRVGGSGSRPRHQGHHRRSG